MFFKRKNNNQTFKLKTYTEDEFKEVVRKSHEEGKKGDPLGMVNIAISYKNGVNGYPKDREKAKRILQAVIDLNASSMAVSLAELELKDL